MSTVPVTAPTWGREVESATVQEHPVLQYRDRPRAVADFLLTARRWGGRELLVQGERRLSVADHEAAVARVAEHLAVRGVAAGDRVAVLAFNSIEWMVTFWAVQALGATAVLGNAWWGEGEAEAALATAEPDLVVTDRETSRPRVTIATVRELVEEADRVVPLPSWPADEDAVAIIMFSSGTTGAPKGVVMSQRSVVANIHNLLVLTGRLPDELPEDHRGTVSMMTVPLFHLAGVQVLCTTLLSGGRLVLLEGKFDPARVLELIEAEGVRSWGSIPTMVSRVLDHPDIDRRDVSSVGSIPMGGAAVTADLRQRIAQKFTGMRSRASSLYGLTEAGGVLVAGRGSDITERPGCIGRALPVVELRVNNPNGDGIGELQARTPTATYGYLGHEERVTDSDGWIGSGDLGRIDADGWVYLTGRLKDIIIRGGENIASAHVEQALTSHPEVLEAAVVPLPHPDLGEEVGAAVVLASGSDLGPADLTAHVSAQLASFERPTRWWRWEGGLPTNAPGKILRREVQDAWVARGPGDDWPAEG